MIRALLKLSLFLLVALAANIEQCSAKSLHIILVKYDEKVDPDNALPGAEVSYNNLAANLDRLAKTLNLVEDKTLICNKYSPSEVCTLNFTTKSVFAAIERLKVQPDEDVIFYYIGHGFRDKNKSKSFFPAMYIPDNENYPKNVGIEETVIEKLLLAKHPKLLIISFDSCNWPSTGIPLKQRLLQGLLLKLPNGKPSDSVRNMEALLNQSGDIVMAGAAKNTAGYYDSTWGGGLFTSTLIAEINETVAEDNPTWDEVISKAVRPINYTKCIQYPMAACSPSSLCPSLLKPSGPQINICIPDH